MIINGKVKFINKRNGFVAIEVENAYSIAEIAEIFSIEIEDSVYWNHLEDEILYNKTKNEKYDASFQNHDINESMIKELMHLN